MSVLARLAAARSSETSCEGVQFLEDFAVSDDDRQEVVEVVCDVAGKRADRFDALNRLKLLLAALQVAFSVQALDLARDSTGEKVEQSGLVRIRAEIASCDDDHRAHDFIAGSDERNGDVRGRIDRLQQRVSREERFDVRSEAGWNSVRKVLARRVRDGELEIRGGRAVAPDGYCLKALATNQFGDDGDAGVEHAHHFLNDGW